jgi:ABC-type polysaccharide/polyol phosphate transport system ATPase subunit
VIPAIEIADVSKAFRIPHESRTTIKEHFLHPLNRSTYEVNEALRNVTLTVEEGEFFGIVGPNGSGKSTLLKIKAGSYQPDSGSVRRHGLLSPFLELGVGFNPDLTARDNVRINGTLLGLSRKELNRRFDDVIEFAELERFVDQKLKNFSSGMQVRLAYAIAIQVDFDILLLDEVLAVGDAAFQEKCFATFDRLLDEGKTIVFVSHDLNAVKAFCGRAALIRGGNVEAVGPPSMVIERYLTDETTHAAESVAAAQPA